MKNRIEDIELLRGLAVLFVVVYHASTTLMTWTTPALTRFYSYFGGGFGVDLFFAISGFVIARDLVPRLQSSNDFLSALRITLAFWTRRAWRLLPSAWLWLAIILLAAIGFNQSGTFGSFRTNFEATIAAVLHVANIRFAELFMQWDYGASFVYWSLSLEEQFYLAFPFLILLTRRLLPYALVGMVLLQLFTLRTPMLMMFRTDALALGILIALWSAHPSYKLFQPAFLARGWWGPVILVGLLACLAALGTDQLRIVSVRIGMIALLCAVLVLIASYDRDYLFPRGAFKNLMIWFGTRSYAIYLIHVPAFFFTREIWHRLYPDQASFGDQFFYHFVLTAGALIIVLSELNYRFIECPLREHGKRIAQRMLTGREISAGTDNPIHSR
ncbi:acyltransferase family protein [Pseudomonas sp. UBA2684]|uniref:acyltransferase family protein n=1 Tax=Pseudomonas sp. UBA2684 TaxID=1947311 RepID=UPI000E9FD194|nr:acyltransferase [Pseudomonas sp. UBA2684]HBX55222.1 acyltransferase [Pseudomonas sp.]|tara:strand:- start:10485 stop:11642 length:1158 start_codon:yes stop_codon:yes gene_type:complete